ncbi:MAG: ATP synthase F0F1 subunit epsilon [Sulfurovum sp. AS07-7]|nr:MAG: ATP synthase F0F1 subunit epsilon [Sulfurovum sp. AS07-7]
MELMKLEIVTPDGVVFNDDVKQVTLPGGEGEFGVLAHHESLVSLLCAGVITIETVDNKTVSVAINSGYVKVSEEETLCIVDGAVALNGDKSDLAKNLEKARKLLSGSKASSMAIASAMGKVEQICKIS